jgi:hypothetical protein
MVAGIKMTHYLQVELLLLGRQCKRECNLHPFFAPLFPFTDNVLEPRKPTTNSAIITIFIGDDSDYHPRLKKKNRKRNPPRTYRPDPRTIMSKTSQRRNPHATRTWPNHACPTIRKLFTLLNLAVTSQFTVCLEYESCTETAIGSSQDLPGQSCKISGCRIRGA